MDKNIFFMAGLPRSGGTLIASILNQNLDIYVSPNSALLNTLGSVYNQYNSAECKDVDQRENVYSVLDGLIPLFYETRQEKYIIDKNFFWLDDLPLSILNKHLRNDIRVVCPVRNVMHMIASWSRMCDADPSNKHDIDMLAVDDSDRPMPDKRADFFMNGDRIIERIDRMKLVLHHLPDAVLFVDYDDLVTDTVNTVNSIYEFLEIEPYVHRFDNLRTPHEYTDYWGVANQHMVKPSIDPEQYDIERIFSRETIEKYSGMEFWKQD